MISVIMGAYREKPEILSEAVESILSQTFKNLELIVILDDPENTHLQKYLEEAEKKDRRVRFLINEKNMGLSKTLNRALSLSQGDYIARMDADDISLPERLQKQLEWLQLHDLDLVGGELQMIDESGNPIYSIQTIPSDPEQVKKALKYGTPIPHPTWLVKREVYDTLSGYRAVPQTEDYDFLIRAVLKGYRCGSVPQRVLKYRMTKDSVSRTGLYTQYLYMKALSAAYSKGYPVDIKDIQMIMTSGVDPKKSRKYAEANALLNLMLSQIENHEYKGFVPNGFRLLFTSRPFLDKIKRFALMNCIAKRKS